MPTVATSADAYQDLDRIRQRVDHEPADFFDDNAALRFDELLVELEEEARGIFETLWGDETVLTETDRVDTLSPGDDVALALVYPINDVTTVEYKSTLSADWETLSENRYTSTEHRLILENRTNTNTLRYRQRANPLTSTAQRATWSHLAAKLRVTYDRGFGSEPPQDVQGIIIALVENMLSARKRQQTQAAGTPDEQAQAVNQSDIVTDAIRARIADVTSPGLATISV